METPAPILSITIPTYNRKEILAGNLIPLLEQIEKKELQREIEVVISDNCSTDGTEEFINDTIKKFNVQVIYNRNNENLGAIKNVLKLISLAKGKYWMLYGDDDPVACESLPELVNCLKKNYNIPTFIFKDTWYLTTKMKDYTEAQEFSISDFARKYFYYIGNAGLFAVDRKLAEQALKLNHDNLLKTCWPQTEIFFIAMYLSSAEKKVYASTIVTKHAGAEIIIFINAYYFFETTLYSLLRSALSMNKIMQTNFAEHAVQSIYGVEFFDTFKATIIEHFILYDYEEEKTEFRMSLSEAILNIPFPFNNEIIIINKWINKPKWVLKIWLYLNFMKRILRTELKRSLLYKLLLITPFGFMYVVKHKRIEKINHYKQNGKMQITSQNGYF